MPEEKPTPQDKTADLLPCECGNKDCNIGLLITKYSEKKVKIRIIDSDKIKAVVVKLSDLKKRLKEMK